MFDLKSDVEAEVGTLVPHGMGTLFGQSHLSVNKLNLRPVGQSPLFILR